MSKIRVFHCLKTIGSGGVEQLRLLLAKYLESEIYEQAVVCTWSVGALPSQLDALECKVFTAGSLNHSFDIKTHMKVLKVIKEFEPHIIHGAVFDGVTIASICRSLSRVPIIIGEKISDPETRSLKANLLLKALSSFAHKMIGVLPSVYNYLISTAKINEEKVILINNGVKPPSNISCEEKRALSESLNFPKDCFIIGFVRRLFDNHKRVSDLINAFAPIARMYPRARLLIIGDGPDKDILIDLAESLNVLDRVVFAGCQSDTRPFYNIMNLFVLPSRMEAFGLVLVEAIFAKVPIVASRVGGIPYIVKDKIAGILFTATDVDALSIHMNYLISTPSIAEKMGEKGHDIAMRDFSAHRYVQNIDKLYQSLIGSYVTTNQ